MNYTYITIDDLRLGYDPKGVTGWRQRTFLTLEQALENYLGLPSAGMKALSLTDGIHVLELVQCLPILKNDTEGEDVLASDYTASPLWRELPTAADATETCIAALHLRYMVDGPILIPISSETELPDELRDKHLWLDFESKTDAAIRRAYVVGRGWVSRSTLQKLKDPRPLVTSYQVDAADEQGAYHFLEVEPWAYKLLYSRSVERLKFMMTGGNDHE